MKNYIRRKLFEPKQGPPDPDGYRSDLGITEVPLDPDGYHFEHPDFTEAPVDPDGYHFERPAITTQRPVTSQAVTYLQEDISQVDPAVRLHGINTTRFQGARDRILETVEFREWRDGKGGADKAALFCSGNPGVGKTYLR